MQIVINIFNPTRDTSGLSEYSSREKEFAVVPRRSDLAVPAFTRDDEAVNASSGTHLAQRCTRGGSRGFCKTAAQQRGTYIWAWAYTHRLR